MVSVKLLTCIKKVAHDFTFFLFFFFNFLHCALACASSLPPAASSCLLCLSCLLLIFSFIFFFSGSIISTSSSTLSSTNPSSQASQYFSSFSTQNALSLFLFPLSCSSDYTSLISSIIPFWYVACITLCKKCKQPLCLSAFSI